MAVDTLLGVGEWAHRQPGEGEPGSRDYAFWLAQAQEVGLNREGGTVDIHAVHAGRQKMIDKFGMAPLDDNGWQWEHARAAQLVMALLVTGADSDNLDDRGSTFLTAAVRATWIHVDGAVPKHEAATLAELAPRIEFYTKSVLEFARMDRELTDLS